MEKKLFKDVFVRLVLLFLLGTLSADPYHGIVRTPSSSPYWWKKVQQRIALDTAYSLPAGLGLREIKVSGTVRFISIYRNMSTYYNDMITSNRNISFVDYPLTNIGANNNGGFPMLELNLASHPLSKMQFSVGYSFASSLTGQLADTATSRQASSRQNLRFGGKWNTGPVRVSIDAGGILWSRISRFTVGFTEYRDNYFDRVPWDWYRNSFLRYEEYYGLSTNIGAEAAGRTPLLGAVANTEILPWGIKITSIYGRTSRNTTVGNALGYFPSYTHAHRIEKNIFTRRVSGKVGLNYYSKQAETDLSKGIPDNNQIVSGDFSLKIRKLKFASEVGVSSINNPRNKNGKGFGAFLKTEIDRTISPIPVSLELYHIDYNMASIDGSIMNSNTTVNDGGFGTEFIYDNMLLMNIAQQVGQIANNRQGFSFLGEGNVGKLKMQLGWAASQELENKYDTITIQHRVNSFSRSRFRPWFQAGGNYRRIKSFWLTTFETISITDTISDYKKGFNTLELFLKYKFKLFNRDLVVLNFNSMSTIQEGFSFIPAYSNRAFVRMWFEDLTLAYKAGKRYNLVANVGLESVKGNSRTNLANENGEEVKENGRPVYKEAYKNNSIDQLGTALGVGIDYDFSNNAGIHLRHKWMNHRDYNFTEDVFRGTETTLELKIFF
ncbi:MAG: hypothetical protein MUF42_02385 [Cytophagaceae bacterium]|jgi:hypothetical protein|nr:hypothetical protein [Cytophagaceae bacterium]